MVPARDKFVFAGGHLVLSHLDTAAVDGESSAPIFEANRLSGSGNGTAMPGEVNLADGG